MRLWHIAIRNVRRHLPATSLLAIMIVTVVIVVAALYLVNRSANSDLADKVDEYGANITVVPRSDQLSLVYGGVQVGDLAYEVEPLTMEQVARIRTIKNKENLDKVAPKLLQATEVGGVELLAAGVQWDQELPLKDWWQIEGVAPVAADEVLVGSRLSARLEAVTGSVLRLGGRDFTVSGVLRPTGDQDDDIVFMDLATAQQVWLRPEEVSFVEVSAWCSSCPIEDIAAQISTVLPGAQVSPMRRAMESRALLVGQFRLFSVIVSVFMATAGILVILASTLSRVRGRKVEIGVFRALGYRRRHIVEIVLLENLLVGVVASVVGVLVAWGISGPFARLAAGVARTAPPDPVLLIGAVAVATIVILAASLYPAWIGSRLSPLLALRKV
jgi:putative ABC transport system permease protein